LPIDPPASQPRRGLAVLLAAALTVPATATPFFAMSYGFSDLTPPEQTAWLAGAGYEGIAVHVWNDELFNRLEQTFASNAVASGGLRVFGVYFPFNLTNPAHRPLASRILRLCQPHGTPLWITVQTPGATDENVVALLRELADEAAAQKLEVIYYPHDNHHCLDAEHAHRLITAADRPNLFNSLHLHQELRAGHSHRLAEIVARVLPRVRLVSVSGANLPDRINRGSNDWSDVVQPLTGSAFDVAGFYRLLVQSGYTGPVGVQNWKIPGDPREHHADSLRLLRAWRDRLPGIP
jgi:sugar phosphate isomerase/epimerase